MSGCLNYQINQRNNINQNNRAGIIKKFNRNIEEFYKSWPRENPAG